MNYKTHRKELLKDKTVKAAHENMQPEYELARSIINQRLKKKMTQQDVADKPACLSPQSPGSRG